MIEREKGAIIELRANHSFAMDRLKETKRCRINRRGVEEPIYSVRD